MSKAKVPYRMKVNYIKSPIGRPMAVCGGFSYFFLYTTKSGTTRWTCTTKGCGVYMWTKDSNPTVVYRLSHKHTCDGYWNIILDKALFGTKTEETVRFCCNFKTKSATVLGRPKPLYVRAIPARRPHVLSVQSYSIRHITETVDITNEEPLNLAYKRCWEEAPSPHAFKSPKKVTMSDRDAAERAVKEANPIIDGRKANVNLAYLGAKPRINAQNGFASPLRTTYPLMIPSQYGSLPPHYLYPSTYLPAPGLILPGPTTAHAPLSPATATVASPFYADYAYPPQYTNGLEASYAPFAAAALASTSAHHHPHSGGGSSAAAAAAAGLPPYLSPAAAAYAYALQPPPAHQGGIPAGAPAHFPMPYPAQPQDARMQ